MAAGFFTDLGILIPDSVIREDYSPSANVTQHPVETGIGVSDHVQPLPLEITVTTRITASPSTLRLLDPSRSRAIGKARLQEALDFLTNAMESGDLVTYVSVRYGIFASMLITGFPHSAITREEATIAVSLREVRFADFFVAVIPPAAVAAEAASSAPSPTEAGQQGTITPADATQATDKSTLLTILGG